VKQYYSTVGVIAFAPFAVGPKTSFNNVPNALVFSAAIAMDSRIV